MAIAVDARTRSRCPVRLFSKARADEDRILDARARRRREPQLRPRDGNDRCAVPRQRPRSGGEIRARATRRYVPKAGESDVHVWINHEQPDGNGRSTRRCHSVCARHPSRDPHRSSSPRSSGLSSSAGPERVHRRPGDVADEVTSILPAAQASGRRFVHGNLQGCSNVVDPGGTSWIAFGKRSRDRRLRRNM